MRYCYILFICIIFNSCNNIELKEIITNPEDYNTFLELSNNKTYKRALSEKEFWSKRLRSDSTGIGDLGPLANAYTLLYDTTGDITYLKNAENILKKAIAISANNKDTYTRSLAQNLISQHRFKEAKLILEESYRGISNKRATRLLLFDVYFELGEYKKADETLGYLKNTNDFNYLIRLAKWNDHRGELKAAIRNLEEALNIADSRKSKSLQIWAYTNLADFYGHAGRIKESYNFYIKTLKLQPDNTYAKKQIAWIAYSYEGNIKEANRILDSIMMKNKSPEYYLFKSEMLLFNGAISESNSLIEKFISTVEGEEYGLMYNNYLIELYTEINPLKSLEIANEEILNRATPEMYSLLAYAQLKVGDKEEAFNTINNLVVGKTLEPKSLYYSALVFNANNKNKKVAIIKKELEKDYFELGPIIAQKISEL